MNRDLKGTDLVIVAVGIALTVLFAGASVILALGHPVPTEFWAAAGALSGALVGILVPPSGAGTPAGDPAALTAATHVHHAALEAAGASAHQFASDPVQNAAAQRALEEVRQRAGRIAALPIPADATVAAQDVASAGAATALVAHTAAADQSVTAAAEAVERTRQANVRLDEARRAAGATQGAPEAKAALLTVPEGAAAEALRAQAQAAARSTVLRDAAEAARTASPAAADIGAKLGSAAPADHLAQRIRALPLGMAKVWLLLVIGVAAYFAGVALATDVGKSSAATAYDTAVKNAADAMIALGSAAGGAIVGLLAPAPAPANGSGKD